MKTLTLQQAYEQARSLEAARARSNPADPEATWSPYSEDPGILMRVEFTQATANFPGAGAWVPRAGVALFTWWARDRLNGPGQGDPGYLGHFASLVNDGPTPAFDDLFRIEARRRVGGGRRPLGVASSRVAFALSSGRRSLGDLSAPFTRQPDGSFAAFAVQDAASSRPQAIGLRVRVVAVTYVG